MPKLIKIKGDASFRSFFRKRINGKSSIVVYAKKEKFKNLLVYDAINKILNKNKILAPRLYTQRYDKNFIEIQDFGNETVFKTLKKIKPKAFLVENVRGWMTMWGGQVFQAIIKKFESAGYNVNFQLMNSADYGIPQVRHRVFIVGIKKELSKNF